MHVVPFGLEIWMNEWETKCEINLAETCVESLTTAQLLDLAGRNQADLSELLAMKMTYGAIEGSDRLRNAIAVLYERQRRENVLVTHGTIGANFLVHQALVGQGNRVVAVVPAYQQHTLIPKSLGAEVQLLHLEESGCLPDLAELRALANPGTGLPKDAIRRRQVPGGTNPWEICPMLINDDLTQPVLVHAGQLEWVPSPAAGVDRKMLHREGGEVARATSLVRYAPGSAFPPHVHSGGEEILVLEGVFQDEHGDYPARSYFRNPPGTSHSPASAEGCTIFVRLWQYCEGDYSQVVRQPGEGEAAPIRDGASAARVLFEDAAERVSIEDWRPGASVIVANRQGLEFFVLSGRLTVNGEELEAQSWGRLPAGQDLIPVPADQIAMRVVSANRPTVSP